MKMFELEDYSSGYHDGFLNKHTESSLPMLDLYLSDSLHDMIDIDIRSEIANVVSAGCTDYDTLLSGCGSLNGDLPSTFDHAMDTISSSIQQNSSASTSSSSSCSNNSHSTSSNHHRHSSGGGGGGGDAGGGGGNNSVNSMQTAANWMGTGPSWSLSNSDYYVDVGACVNPISVMPIISSHMLHKSPKVSLNANGLRSNSGSGGGGGTAAVSPPGSPTGNVAKSHLTFSPAQMKISAGSLRNEQLLSHIPKQIVAISSTVTAATTAPATLATNSVLQRKGNGTSLLASSSAASSSVAAAAAVEAIKKDLGAELKRASMATPTTPSTTTSSTIKLAPGIGGLTFANSVTYNKLKQQAAAKSPQGSPVTANGTIVLKRDRDSSPLHHMATLNGGGGGGGSGSPQITKLLGRSVMQAGGGGASSFTPKSIASAHSPMMQSHSSNSSSPSAASLASPAAAATSASAVAGSSSNTFNGTFTTSSVASSSSPASSSSSSQTNMFTASNAPAMTSIAVKPLHQKIKSTPVESEYPKPAYSYSCLIAMALKNSRSGLLPVSEIYSFMCEHFPYFKSAPNVWKNSVRHNLSLGKCFGKIEKPATNGSQRKGCLWALKPDYVAKMDGEVQKCSRKDPQAIRNAMVYPEHLEALQRGEMKHGSSGDSDVELDSQSEIGETSDMEEQELDETIVDNMLVEEDFDDDVEEDGGGDDDDASEYIDEHEIDNSSSGGGEHILNAAVNRRIVVVNAADHHHHHQHHQHHGVNVVNGTTITAAHHEQQQQHRDFDIEVEDIYDAIDMEDDKDAVQLAINNSSSDIIEVNPAELNASRHHHHHNHHHQHQSHHHHQHHTVLDGTTTTTTTTSGYQSPKRARLSINYSIGPTGELEKQIQQKQQHIHIHPNIKHIKVQTLQQVVQQQQLQQQLNHSHQQHQQQHGGGGGVVQKPQHVIVQTISNGGTTTALQLATAQQFQQLTGALPMHNRRKMQLVNRIA